VVDTVTVHVNRDALHSLEVPETFAVTGGFDVQLVNHGEPTHVHLHLDDSLSDLAAIEAPNHHLKRHSERRVGVTVSEPGQARGNLKVVTGHGATTRYVAITVTEPDPIEQSVEVAEELTTPQPKPTAAENGIALDRATAIGGLGVAVIAVVGVVAVAGWTVGAALVVSLLLIAATVWQLQRY
jgi:hypothetical protein